MLTREPGPLLRPFITSLWVSNQSAATDGVDRERVLPTGRMHLAFELTGRLFRLFDDLDDTVGRRIGDSVIGGARATPYFKGIATPSRSIGAELRTGACEILFGVPASELAGRHTPLEVAWGRGAGDALARLRDAGSPKRQLDLLESLLAARLRHVRALHPAVAHALRRFTTTADVRQTVRETGYSHRRFIAVFEQAVGLTPKRYCRVVRFRRVLERLHAGSGESFSVAAQEADFSDQSHFIREFRQLAGITPGEYRRLAPSRPHHLPSVPPAR